MIPVMNQSLMSRDQGRSHIVFVVINRPVNMLISPFGHMWRYPPWEIDRWHQDEHADESAHDLLIVVVVVAVVLIQSILTGIEVKIDDSSLRIVVNPLNRLGIAQL